MGPAPGAECLVALDQGNGSGQREPVKAGSGPSRHAKSIFTKSNRDKLTRRQPAMAIAVIMRRADLAL
jgi:hypothetical protein